MNMVLKISPIRRDSNSASNDDAYCYGSSSRQDSFSSQCTVNDPTSKDSVLKSNSSVRFDLSKNTCCQRHDGLSKQELVDLGLWYSHDDARAQWDATMNLAHQLASHSHMDRPSLAWYMETMDYLHGLCVSGSSGKKLSSVVLPKLREEDKLDLVGMERWVLPSFAYEQERRKQELRDTVYAARQELNSVSRGERTARLCRQCRSVSKAAKVFAVVMAKKQWGEK